MGSFPAKAAAALAVARVALGAAARVARGAAASTFAAAGLVLCPAGTAVGAAAGAKRTSRFFGRVLLSVPAGARLFFASAGACLAPAGALLLTGS